MAPAKVTIKIPRPLYDRIAEVIRGAGYNSVTDFVVFVLRDIVASHGEGPVSESEIAAIVMEECFDWASTQYNPSQDRDKPQEYDGNPNEGFSLW